MVRSPVAVGTHQVPERGNGQPKSIREKKTVQTYARQHATSPRHGRTETVFKENENEEE